MVTDVDSAPVSAFTWNAGWPLLLLPPTMKYRTKSLSCSKVVMVCWGAICSRGHFSGLQVRVPLELLSQGLQKTVVSNWAGRQQTQAHKREKRI